MTLYETIFARRQVRNYLNTPVLKDQLELILTCVSEADQLTGQHAAFKLLPAAEVASGQKASHYLLAYCDNSPSARANVGFVLQKADLFIQSMGLGCGWFANIKPKTESERFCIALAIGNTEVPLRKGPDDFKRIAVNEISEHDGPITQAVRLAPSSLNSQPWKLDFQAEKLLIHDAGHGMKRIFLKNKLNKIDLGIAARHAVLALEHEGSQIRSATPVTNGKDFYIEISYT